MRAPRPEYAVKSVVQSDVQMAGPALGPAAEIANEIFVGGVLMQNRNIVGVGLLLGLCSRTLGADGIQPKLPVNSVAAGSGYSLAVALDGTVWAWGGNQFGQLGDGTTTNRLTPVRVSGLHDVVAVAAGCAQSLALASDGTVWAWGTQGMERRPDAPGTCPRRYWSARSPRWSRSRPAATRTWH